MQAPQWKQREVHSMTMELLARPFGGVVFGNDAEKIPCISIESALNFIPYGCLVDEFQHEVYENPKLTPQERKKLWLKLEKNIVRGWTLTICHSSKTEEDSKNSIIFIAIRFIILIIVWYKPLLWNSGVKSNRDWKKRLMNILHL